MKVLLDTHLLIWAGAQPSRLSLTARRILEDPEVTPVFSVASIWEVAIKASLDKPEFTVDPAILRHALIANGYEELPITGAHVVAVRSLPWLHKDPFHRLLVAQALTEALTLITVDKTLAAYPGAIRKV